MMFQPLFGVGLILGSLLVLVPKPTMGFTVRLLGNSNGFGERRVVDPLNKRLPTEHDAYPDPNGKGNNREYVPSSHEPYLVRLSVAKPMTDGEIDAYLMRFGYLAVPVNGTVSGKDREAAVKEYQGFSRLSQTGVVDPRTRKQMQTARCGLADPVSSNTFANFEADETDKWFTKDLTYEIAMYSKKLSKEIIRESTEKAFRMWSDVSQLTFKEVSEYDYADIKLSFTPSIHGDGAPFDGPGGVLGHALLPPFGTVHMDDAENWTIQTKKGINLLQVLVHEIGHALGLGHSGENNAIMEASYDGYRPNFKLSVDDIAGIQFLYGKPLKPKPPTKAPTTNAPTNKAATTNPPATKAPTTKAPVTTSEPTAAPRTFPCPFPFWATMTVGNQTFGFIQRSVYKVSSNGEYNRLSSISSMFSMGPTFVTAAAYNDVTGHTFLFLGQQVWRYTDDKLDKGFPKKINTFIQAAFVLYGHLIGFSSTHVHYFDEDTLEDYVNGKVSIADEYPGLPSDIGSALAYTDGSAYLFYTRKHYRVDIHPSEGASCTGRGYK